MLLGCDFDFFGGYVVVTARCLVVSRRYLVVSARYLWLLMVTARSTFNMNAATLLKRDSATGIFL